MVLKLALSVSIKSCIYLIHSDCIALGVGLVGFIYVRSVNSAERSSKDTLYNVVIKYLWFYLGVRVMMESTSVTVFRLVVFVFFQAFVVSAALRYDPKPNPGSVVKVGQARFTVLTSHLIRLEWGDTNDAATFSFINRNLPTPQFNTSKDGDWAIIQTSAVTVL